MVNNVYNSVSSYFDALSKFGFKAQKDVDKLLVYIFIEELLTGEFRQFITEEDYRAINKAIECLYGTSCLIPFVSGINDDSIFHTSREEIPRLTEGTVLRVTETDLPRFMVK